MSEVARLITGHYVAQQRNQGPAPPVVTVAYLVRHADATILFDTGFPFDSRFTVREGDTELITYPRSLEAAVRSEGYSLDSIDVVVNCHLHIDHAGGNRNVPSGTPIYTQHAEHSTALDEHDQLVSDALALSSKAYRIVHGEYELLAGVRLIPTPGHTPGHQSMAIDTPYGRLVLLGQAARTASEFAGWVYASTAAGDTAVEHQQPDWLPHVLSLEPSRVALAHDLATWMSTF
jgi:N-acyl homoserine lactone hydrolase